MIGETQGWGWPGQSYKAHYFMASRSLCGKWTYTGRLDDEHHDSFGNCAECKKRRTALLAKADAAAGRES
jgi:hypothetical protein